MKQLLLALLLAASLVTQGWSQGAQAELVKQKAEQIRANNNRQQGVTTPAAPSVTYQNTSTAPADNNPQLKLVERVTADLVAIKVGTAMPLDQKTNLANDITALSKVATKPTKETMLKLAGDLSTAVAEKSVSPADLDKLSRYINVVLNCNLLPINKAAAFVTSAQTLLKNAGVSDAAIQTITTDLNGIVTLIQKNKAQLYQ